ncbi:MAG: S8 family serine peptidase [Nanoarchaeota archaeon]|nr:S8 family serine peptidase [Nanoarchaeota archaeon]
MKRRLFWVFGVVLIALFLPLMFAVEDAYEPDNVWGNATTIVTNGSRQTHTFDVSGDVDYVNFSAVAGVQYVIETYRQGAVDTQITLYSTDGTTRLDSNDDIEDGYQQNSRIVLDATADGTYYFNISDYNSSQTGTYEVSVLEQGRMIPSLVSHTANANVTKNKVFEFTTSVQCLSADCYNVTATLDPEPFAVIPSLNERAQKIKPKIQKPGKAETEVYSMLEEQEKVSVIVIMKQKDVKAKGKKAALSYSAFGELLNKGFEKKHEYVTFNGFSGKVTKEALAELENNPDVEAIYYDREVHIMAEQPNMLQINADDAWAMQVDGVNITGADETICIIDTGINYSHADFGSCVKTSDNINDGWCPKVIGGYTSLNQGATENSNPYDDHNYLGSQGHGTHVAGIAASQSVGYQGVAPNAKIVAIKALDNTGSGYTSDIDAGIDWCIANAVRLNITSISMSLGGRSNYSYYCPNDALRVPIDTAILAGIPVFVASGNIGYSDKISTPACIENATSVGAVNGFDIITYNRARILDLLAPGVSITATDYDGTHVSMSGTSMSTPHAAALALLLKQYAKLKFSRNLTAEQLKHAITANGKMVFDSSSNLSFPRIDALASIDGKGIIPTTVGAKPFYSLTPNPHNASCLSHIVQGETCSTTWQVNVTGDAHDTFAFFVIYTTDYKRNDSAKVNLTISLALPVSLNSPSNSLNSNNQSQIFNCSVANVNSLTNISLYGNFNGTWLLNSTSNISGTDNSSAWQINIPDGSFEWNCYACNDERCDFASANYSLAIDTAMPQFTNLSYPAVIELGDEQSISINLTDAHLTSGNISYSGANYTMLNSTSNFSHSYTHEQNGTLNFTIYAFDAAGNMNSTAGSFYANDTSNGTRIKSVYLASSTLALGSNQTITAYIYDKWQPLNVYFGHNGTNITMPNNTLTNFSYSWVVSQCGTVTYKIYANNSQGIANTTTGTFTSNNCCGNGVCDGSDTCSSCSADCGACSTTTSSGGGGGGGGGGSISAAANTASIVLSRISPSNPAKVSISNSEIPVSSIRIDVAAEIAQARVQVTALKEQPSSVKSPEKPVYRYLDISTGIDAKDIVSSEIVFTAAREWLLENGILKDNVVLLRFNEGEWVEMPTSYLMSKDNLHYYSASVGGFSVFAISVKEKKIVPEKKKEEPKEEAPEVSGMAVIEEPEVKIEPFYIKPALLVLGILFGLAMGAALFMHRRHRRSLKK